MSVRHAKQLSLRDQSTALFAKYVWLNTIITAFGTFLFIVRIRQCVGQKNYKYFISFLGLHSIWCLFLSKIGYQSLIEYLHRIKFWDMVFNMNGQPVKSNSIIALQFLFMTQTIFFFLIVMCAIMGFTLFVFVGYHLYLVSKGQTTN